MNEHITFEEMVDYVFVEDRPNDFFETAAKMNYHIMNCEECGKMYNALMDLNESVLQYNSVETEEQRIFIKVFGALYMLNSDKTVSALVEESKNFKVWISFDIINQQEIMSCNNNSFIHPHMVSAMKSSTDDEAEISNTEIQSSIFDKNNNRVSIGLDGTLSLYFDSSQHKAGQRVILLPDDEELETKIIEMKRYDSSICSVRFEGITPGKYTVVVENN